MEIQFNKSKAVIEVLKFEFQMKEEVLEVTGESYFWVCETNGIIKRKKVEHIRNNMDY